MLSLTRKEGESIVIRTEDGTQVRVLYYKNQGDQIRLSIDAPSRIQVNREEIDRKIYPEDYPAGS